MKPVPGTIQYAIEAYEREMRLALLEKIRRDGLEAMLTKP